MPLDGERLVIEPSYPWAEALGRQIGKADGDDTEADAVAWLADRLEMPTGDVRALLEEAEDNGVLIVRVVTDDPADDHDVMKAIYAAGRGACLCSLSTIERVVLGTGTCGRGGCPYGGDL